MVNANGERFVDEGADFRNYTYAKYGRVILSQPGQFAWQIFDSKVLHLLRDEYRIKRSPRSRPTRSRSWPQKLEGVDAGKAASTTISAYNAAVQTRRAVQPERQGRPRHRGPGGAEVELGQHARRAAVRGLSRSPAASPSPSAACKIDTGSAQVIDTDGAPIPGLYAAGELVGGLFYFNYPGGTGLMSGSVFGRIAGMGASRATPK